MLVSVQYSRGSNTDHLKTEHFHVLYWDVQFSNGWLHSYSYCIGTDHSKIEHSEPFKMAALAWIVLY